MKQVKLTADMTSFEVDLDPVTEESLDERYLRLMREWAAASGSESTELYRAGVASLASREKSKNEA
jgi:hypothetical protein